MIEIRLGLEEMDRLPVFQHFDKGMGDYTCHSFPNRQQPITPASTFDGLHAMPAGYSSNNGV
jgi:hypothetical protein